MTDGHADGPTSALGTPGHLSDIVIEGKGEGDMSSVRSTSRIEEVENGYGNDEENELEPRPEDGDEGPSNSDKASDSEKYEGVSAHNEEKDPLITYYLSRKRMVRTMPSIEPVKQVLHLKKTWLPTSPFESLPVLSVSCQWW